MSAKMYPVGWFEIPVADMARAKAFYEHVFDIDLQEHEMGRLRMASFPMREGMVGAAGSLVKADSYTPSTHGVLIYFTTPDLDAAVARVREKAGNVLAEKFSIGEHGFIALIQDTEGNRVGLHSRQ